MSELSRTILQGGRLQSDAMRDLISVRANKRARKQDAFKQVGLALRDVGETLKQHGDWKTAKAEEAGLKELYEADALGAAQNGAEGRLVALKALRPPTAKVAAARDALMRDAEETVKADLTARQDQAWKSYLEAQRQKRHEAELRWEQVKERGQVQLKAKELRAEERKARRAQDAALRREEELEKKFAAFNGKLDTGTATVVDAIEMARAGGGFDNRTFENLLGAIKSTTAGDIDPKNAGAKAMAADLDIPYYEGMTIDDVQQERDARLRQQEDPGGVSERETFDYRKASDRLKSAVDQAKDAEKAWQGTFSDNYGGGPQDKAMALEAFLDAAAFAFSVADEEGRDPPYSVSQMNALEKRLQEMRGSDE